MYDSVSNISNVFAFYIFTNDSYFFMNVNNERMNLEQYT